MTIAKSEWAAVFVAVGIASSVMALLAAIPTVMPEWVQGLAVVTLLAIAWVCFRGYRKWR